MHGCSLADLAGGVFVEYARRYVQSRIAHFATVHKISWSVVFDAFAAQLGLTPLEMNRPPVRSQFALNLFFRLLSGFLWSEFVHVYSRHQHCTTQDANALSALSMLVVI